jgi:hypothetical protein
MRVRAVILAGVLAPLSARAADPHEQPASTTSRSPSSVTRTMRTAPGWFPPNIGLRRRLA